MMLPILYSYRRCPYAMRARLALKLAEIDVEIREISLRDKPAHMLQVSPKATVPVLVLPDGNVIDESLAIMVWAFDNVADHTREKNNALQPQGLSPQNIPAEAGYSYVKANIHAGYRASPESALIETNDTSFKKYLDGYKYPERYPSKSQLEYRQLGEIFLQQLEVLLQQKSYLLGAKFGMADLAIFPFIRQFAAVESAWFETSHYPALRAWLNGWLNSDLFNSIMKNPDANQLTIGFFVPTSKQ